MALQMKLWGVRGSIPAPLSPEIVEQRIRKAVHGSVKAHCKNEIDVNNYLTTLSTSDFGGYGGNTACVEVSSSENSVFIDGGSGLRAPGLKLLSGPLGKGAGEAHIFFTHFHWDHLIGLPFFVPLFIPGNKIHLYAVQANLESVIRDLFRKPNFPVPFERLGATVVFHQLEPRKPIYVNGMSLTPYQLDHPDPCWGYRIQAGNRAIAYCVDTECIRTSRGELGPDLPLYQGVDVMIFDAQYTISETTEKIDWGHAAAPYGLDIAFREKIEKVYFVHHDPNATDARIGESEAQAREYFETFTKDLAVTNDPPYPRNWCFAREGTEITLED